MPIVDEDGVLVGAIGVSGSTVENDHAVAEAGVKVLGVTELPEHPVADVRIRRSRKSTGAGPIAGLPWVREPFISPLNLASAPL